MKAMRPPLVLVIIIVISVVIVVLIIFIVALLLLLLLILIIISIYARTMLLSNSLSCRWSPNGAHDDNVDDDALGKDSTV